jgi:fido (protein-threonine AMPylation protein)
MSQFLQKEFTEFHTKIKQDDYGALNEKRTMLIQELRSWLKANEKPGFNEFNQGSYAMKTTIEPLDAEDYDIDVGLEFHLCIDDYEPTEVKQWVIDAFSAKVNRNVEPKTPCVRVQYIKDGDPKFHLDFAIYGRDDASEQGKDLYLAKGKPKANEENKKWDPSDPFALKKIVNTAFEDAKEQFQMRRAIRALKRWKDFKFAEGNGRPTGIALTAMALDFFKPVVFDPITKEEKVSDLKAIRNLVSKIIDNNYGLDVVLPVEPGNNLCSKLKNSDTSVADYKSRLEALHDALKSAANHDDAHDAALILQKQFGSDFPVPPKEEKSKVTSAPAIAPSIGSA